MHDAVVAVPLPVNEPVLTYAPGTAERTRLKAELERQSADCPEIPLVIGGQRVTTGKLVPVTMPHAHKHVVARFHAADPSRVVALGDSFHRVDSARHLDAGDLDFLLKLQKGREWYWICGNHDPHLPASVGGTVCATLTIGGVTLRHEPSEAASGPEIVGHLHPVARIARRGAVVRRRCFATDGHRLVMPAFGAYAGGLNVLDEAFRPLFRLHLLEAWMMGRRAVYPVLGSLLLPD